MFVIIIPMRRRLPQGFHAVQSVIRAAVRRGLRLLPQHLDGDLARRVWLGIAVRTLGQFKHFRAGGNEGPEGSIVLLISVGIFMDDIPLSLLRRKKAGPAAAALSLRTPVSTSYGGLNSDECDTLDDVLSQSASSPVP